MRKKIILIIFFILIFNIKNVKAYDINSLDLNNTKLINEIKNGTTKLSYETFSVPTCNNSKGTNCKNVADYIKAIHIFANDLKINNIYDGTIYACNSNNCSDKTYYIAEFSSSYNYYKSAYSTPNQTLSVIVLTNVDWQGAKFIIDDFVIDGTNNKVKTNNAVFKATSDTWYRTGSYFKTINVSDLYKVIEKGTSHLEGLTSYVNDKIAKDEKRKDLKETNIWQLYLEDKSQNVYIRSSSNADEGYSTRELLIYNKLSENIINGSMDWTFSDDLNSKINIMPIREDNITLENGTFLTLATNAYKSSGESFDKRGIQITCTGNITLKNISHYLDESANISEESQYKGTILKNTSDVPSSVYSGFINIDKSSYITLDNIVLTPHTFGNINSVDQGTYDLEIDYSSNITINKLTYPKNNFEGTSIEYSYSKYMLSNELWGIIATNTSKNLVFTNSFLNRIDSHRGLTNLYVYNSTIGNKGFTLTGQGDAIFEKVKVDSADAFITLRWDYGSTWNGDIIIKDCTYIIASEINNKKEYPNNSIVFSDNNQTNYYGYQTYYPNVYINNFEIDTDTRTKQPKSISLFGLYNISENETIVDQRATYIFKSNYYIGGTIKVSQNNPAKINIFDDNFVTNNKNFLVSSYYGKNSDGSIYGSANRVRIVNKATIKDDSGKTYSLNNNASTNLTIISSYDSSDTTYKKFVYSTNNILSKNSNNEYQNEISLNKTIHLKTVTPISDNFCKNTTYNGEKQQITNIKKGIGYTIDNIEGTNAGSYKIKLTLDNNYKDVSNVATSSFEWTSGEIKGEKTITCSISKATPEINLDGDNSIKYKEKKYLNIYSNINGVINISYQKDIISSDKIFTIEKNKTTKIPIEMIKNIDDKENITLNFIPEDKTNYNDITITKEVATNKVEQSVPEISIPVYRLYNKFTGEHLYTTDTNEKEVLYTKHGWGYEGIGWYTTNSGKPIYRLYNPGLGNHLYTSDDNEIEVLTTSFGWRKDNNGLPVMYSSGTIPVYRVYNKGLRGMHHLTTNEEEYNKLPEFGWKQEGISMLVYKIGNQLDKTDYYNK